MLDGGGRRAASMVPGPVKGLLSWLSRGGNLLLLSSEGLERAVFYLFLAVPAVAYHG